MELRYFWHSRCYFRTSSRVPSELIVHAGLLKGGQRVGASNHRRSPRIRLQMPVFLRASDASGSEFIELTKTLNISSTGACVASAHLLRPEQIVHLTIPAPSTVSSGVVPPETPPITARVLRQEVAGDLRLFGLEFLKPLE